MTHKHHIFLSYSRHDAEIMRQVRATLQAEGLTVWSMEGIEPGTPLWDRAVEDALKAAECMVVILTPNVIESKGVRDEIHYAQIHKVQIFPLLAAGDQQTSIPYTISGVQFTDIRTRFAYNMERLAEAVRRVVGLEDVVPPLSVEPPKRQERQKFIIKDFSDLPFVGKAQSATQAPQPIHLESQPPAWQGILLLLLKIVGVLAILVGMGLTLAFTANWAGYATKQCGDGDGLCNERWLYGAMTLGLAIAFSFIFRRIAGWWHMHQWQVWWLYAVVLLAGSLDALTPDRDVDINIALLLTILAFIIVFFLHRVSKLPVGWLRRFLVRDA